MNKPSLWLYSGITGLALSLASTLTLLARNAHPERNLPQEVVAVAKEVTASKAALRSSTYATESNEYKALLKNLEHSRSNYLAIASQPRINEALQQEFQRERGLVSALGASITLSIISFGAAYHGIRLQQR